MFAGTTSHQLTSPTELVQFRFVYTRFLYCIRTVTSGLDRTTCHHVVLAWYNERAEFQLVMTMFIVKLQSMHLHRVLLQKFDINFTSTYLLSECENTA